MKRCLLLLLSALLLCGCSREVASVTTVPTEQETRPVLQAPPETTAVPTEAAAPFSYRDLQFYPFTFASGAGAWQTRLSVYPDGSFQGEYHDSEMGEAGEDYPKGTVYFCPFQGRFGEPVAVDAHTWSLPIEELTWETQEEEILEGIRYVYTGPYGMEKAEGLLLYLPDTPVGLLPEGYKLWACDLMSAPQDSRLDFYGLYNEAAETGFTSVNLSRVAHDAVNIALENELAPNHTLYEDETADQATLNLAAASKYALWDEVLNELWFMLKSCLHPDAMEALTREELDWIAQKEAAVAQAGKAVEGGTLYHLVTSEKAAQLTKERVLELLEYFS